MFRRFVRIFWLVGSIGFIVSAVFAQFCWFDLEAGRFSYEEVPEGVELAYHQWYSQWGGPFFGPYLGWSGKEFLSAPIWDVHLHVAGTYDHVVIRIPWWIVLPVWGLVAAIVWRMTRPRQGGHAFPVESKTAA